MIKTQRKQLYKQIVLFLLAFSPLAIFLFMAIFIHRHVSIVLIVCLVALIIYLIYLYNQLINVKASVSLRIQDQHERINLSEAEIAHEQKAIRAFQDKIVQSSLLKELTEKLSQCLTLDETIKTLSAEIPHILPKNNETFILYLFQSKSGDLGLTLSQRNQMQINIKAKKGDIFDQWVVKNLQPLIVEDVPNDFRFDMHQYNKEEHRVIGSLISVPLLVNYKAWGIIRLDSPLRNSFSVMDLRFLRTIGDLSAVAIENAKLYERLQEMAIKDGLTGLYLKRYLLERMTEELSRHLRSHDEVSFLMIDLDKFKDYNDSYGHIAGDIVLRTIGKLLAEFFNEPGFLVCRYGGEEFAILLPNCSKSKAKQLAEKVRSKIEAHEILLRREKTRITVSIGVAAFPQDGQLKEDIIFKADKALYKAKETGRNKVCST